MSDDNIQESELPSNEFDGSASQQQSNQQQFSVESGNTNSSDPKMIASRLFIGNLPTDKVTNSQVEERFSKYGRIIGLKLLKGFGFVQYADAKEAQVAVAAENGSTMEGQRLDIRIASQKQKEGSAPRDRGQAGRGRGGGGGGPTGSRPSSSGVKRPHDNHGGYSSFEDRMYQDVRPPMGPVGGGYLEEGYRDRFDAGAPPRFGMRGSSPFGNDSLRCDYGAPREYERDAFSNRQPYRDPYSDPYGPPAAKRAERAFDVVVIVAQKPQKAYAEMIERRLLDLSMTVDMIFLVHDSALQKAIDDMSHKGVLYVVVVQPQHESHRSITVNILHGTPQEHRNMPLDDALMMLARNFNAYLSNLRGPQDVSIGFLLNLLADGKHLSVGELNKVIAHLQDRRDRLVEAEGGRAPARSMGAAFGSSVPASLGQSSMSDLQQRILSILSGTAQAVAADANAPSQSVATMASMAQQYGLSMNKPAPAPPVPLPSDALPKAIDALIKNPDLLSSLTRQLQGPGASAAVPSTALQPPPVPRPLQPMGSLGLLGSIPAGGSLMRNGPAGPMPPQPGMRQPGAPGLQAPPLPPPAFRAPGMGPNAGYPGPRGF